MKIAVGSNNPVKIGAVNDVFSNVFGECEVVGTSVSSGVSEQPFGDEETIKGARNRALAALKKEDASYGVGLEGGVYEQGGKLFECAWVVVVNSQGDEGLGGGLRFEMPPEVSKRIRKGEELGPVMDQMLDRKDVKKKEGAVGVLTGSNVTRQSAYQHILYLALVRFISPNWYK